VTDGVKGLILDTQLMNPASPGARIWIRQKLISWTYNHMSLLHIECVTMFFHGNNIPYFYREFLFQSFGDASVYCKTGSISGPVMRWAADHQLGPKLESQRGNLIGSPLNNFILASLGPVQHENDIHFCTLISSFSERMFTC